MLESAKYQTRIESTQEHDFARSLAPTESSTTQKFARGGYQLREGGGGALLGQRSLEHQAIEGRHRDLHVAASCGLRGPTHKLVCHVRIMIRHIG